MRFEDAFTKAATREEVVTFFLAMLELLRLGQMHIQQDKTFGSIELIAGKAKPVKQTEQITLTEG